MMDHHFSTSFTVPAFPLQVRGAPLLAMVSALGLAVEALERAKAKREAALLISWMIWMLFTGQMAESVESELAIMAERNLFVNDRFIHLLVGGLEHFLFFQIYRIIIPID